MPTSEDMSPLLPVLLPWSMVRYQVATRGHGTRSHPYLVGDHFSYAHRVLEGVGCHRRDRGCRIVAGGLPKSCPSDIGDSNPSSLACGRCHSGVVQPQSPIDPGYMSVHNFYGFKFRLLTSCNSHTHSFSHWNHPTFSPFVLLSPPLRFTHQDEHGQRDKNRLWIFQSCPQATMTNTSVTNTTLGISNQVCSTIPATETGDHRWACWPSLQHWSLQSYH